MTDKVVSARREYARQFAAAAGSSDARLEDIVAGVPREDFVGPGPWTIVVHPWRGRGESRRFVTPDKDPSHLYTNSLVALDSHRNNGEPFLHAAWIGRVKPEPGEIVTHIGAGTGYYTAILSRLVMPRGEVFAYEIDAKLAGRAIANLKSYDNVTIGHADGVTAELPPSDIIYVNAGAVAPPVAWLKALRPGGRLIFPWRPVEKVGLAVVVTRCPTGYSVDPFMTSWFIPCVGATIAGDGSKLPSTDEARESRSIWLTSERQPDATATAIFGDIWFSAEPVKHLPARPGSPGRRVSR